MPRPPRRRADVLKAAAAREAARAAKSSQNSETNASEPTGDALNLPTTSSDKVQKTSKFLMSGALSKDGNEQSSTTEAAEKESSPAKTRLAREEEAAARAIESLRNTRTKAVSTPRNHARNTRTASAAPSTLQVRNSQSSQDAAEQAPTNTRARNIPMAPMSVRKPMSTPRAEASMLALANFKRRSRAPSVLGIGDADETASISSDGSFGDLMPDDESTPLPKPGAQRQLDRQLLQQHTPVADDDDDEGGGALPPRSSSSRKRKRGSSKVQVPFSQSTPSFATPQTRSKDVIAISSAEHTSSSDEILPEMARDPMPSTPSVSSSVMAPPASSSPVKPAQSSAMIPSSPPPPAKSRKGGRADTAASGIAKSWNRSRAKKELDIDALVQLLPKRQQRVQEGDFEVYSSDGSADHDASDADELSRAPSKRRRAAGRRQRSALAERAAPAKGGRRGTRSANNKVAAAAKRNSRTYSRRLSDKENVIDSDVSAASDEEVDTTGNTSFADTLQEPTQELKDAALKFAEVDKWELAYEDVVPPSSNSFMADAR